MKVKELIEQLQQVDPELDVVIQESDLDYMIVYNHDVQFIEVKEIEYYEVVDGKDILKYKTALVINPTDGFEEEDNEFNCNSCGACCRLVGYAVTAARNIPEQDRTLLQQEVAEFPHAFDKTGKCEHLKSDNTCAIYATRPNICSVEKTFDNHFLGNRDRKEYYSMSEKYCEVLDKQVNGKKP